ncbi:hypothetical protein AN1V17_41830 [Vallitalea sediminicola]
MSNKLRKLLTFNEDNKEILDLLNNKSNASQYVCEAVRFYEHYRNMAVSMTRIEDKIDLILSKDKTNNSINNSSNHKTNNIPNDNTNDSILADETVKTIGTTGTPTNNQEATEVMEIKQVHNNRQLTDIRSTASDLKKVESIDSESIDSELKNLILSEED